MLHLLHQYQLELQVLQGSFMRFLCLLEMPYGYYQLVRFLSFSCFAFLIFSLNELNTFLLTFINRRKYEIVPLANTLLLVNKQNFVNLSENVETAIVKLSQEEVDKAILETTSIKELMEEDINIDTVEIYKRYKEITDIFAKYDIYDLAAKFNTIPTSELYTYQQLLNDFSYTHDELAAKLSKSRPAITNTMRLLNLPPSVQRKVAAGVISAGHARALLSLTDEKEIENLANRIVAEGLTVRAVEEIVATGAAKVKGGSVRSGKIIAPKLKEISDQLSDHLDTRVNVELGKQKGKIVIEFATIEDLERISKVITD